MELDRRRDLSLAHVQIGPARVNYLLNLSLFAAVTAATYSGIVISQKAIRIIAVPKPRRS